LRFRNVARKSLICQWWTACPHW